MDRRRSLGRAIASEHIQGGCLPSNAGNAYENVVESPLLCPDVKMATKIGGNDDEARCERVGGEPAQFLMPSEE